MLSSTTVDARSREHISYGYRGAARGYETSNDEISLSSLKTVASSVKVGVDTTVFLDTTDGRALVTRNVSDENGSTNILTTLHSVKPVLGHHLLPCDVVELVFEPGDRKSH